MSFIIKIISIDSVASQKSQGGRGVMYDHKVNTYILQMASENSRNQMA